MSRSSLRDEEELFHFYCSQIRDLHESIVIPMIVRHMYEIENSGRLELAKKLRPRIREYLKNWRRHAKKRWGRW